MPRTFDRTRLLPLLSLAATALSLAACNDEVGLNRVNGKIAADEVIDFGTVQVGIIATAEIEVKNDGPIGVHVKDTQLAANFTDAAYEFGLTEKTFAIAPHDSKKIQVTFQPLMASDTPYETQLVFVSDIDDEANRGQMITVTVHLKGTGVLSGLLIEPNPVQFGAVLVGSSRTLDVKITNLLSQPVDVKSEIGADQKAKIVTMGGHGIFELLSPLQPNGSLLPANTQLDPQTSVTVKLQYTPDPTEANRDDFGRWVISNCNNSLCEVEIHMSGKGTNTGLDCMPGAIDFASINPGRSATRTVTCMNVSTGPVTISGWNTAMGSAREFSVSPFPSTSPVVNPGEMFNVDVKFAPTLMTLGQTVMGTMVILTHSDSAMRDLDPVQVQLTGRGGGPTIIVLPSSLDFGRIAIGTSYSRPLLVQNTGYDDLIVTSVAPMGHDAAAFSADNIDFTLATGSSTVVNVTFAPTVEAPNMADLVFDSNDGSTPMLAVPLTGIGVALPPCAYTLTPSMVNFGVVPTGETGMSGVRIQNNGTDDCLVNDVALSGDMAFTLVNGPETNVVIPGGASKDIPINYTPPVAGNNSGMLSFYISDPNASMPTVPLFGVGLAQTTIACPPAVTTPAGTPVTLNLNTMTQGTSITSINWAITSAPTGGIGTPTQWTPDPPTSASEIFLPYIVGVYAIHVTVVDSSNMTLSCDTQVTAEGHGLRVQLTWDGSADLDLHVHSPNTAQPWFTNPDDCYYADRTPLWNAAQAAATGENPQLDFDNVTAFGPENTRVDTVVLNQPYTIAVHNYSRGAGRIATLDVFCGGVTSASQTFTSPVLNGSAGGNCTTNDFWKVASVTFTSQTNCTITPINTIVQSATACTSF